MNIFIGILAFIGILSLWVITMLIYTPDDEEYTKKQTVISWGCSLITICLLILDIIWIFNNY